MAKYRAIQRPRYAEGFDQLYYVSIGESGQFIIREWQESEENSLNG